MPSTSAVRCWAATKISLPILNRIPASKAAARDAGIFFTRRSKLPVSPQMVTSTAQVI
ncbi:hypothetical protein D9M71_811130 [compost metagenome]